MNPAFYSLATVTVLTLSLATTEPAVATDAPALAKAASVKTAGAPQADIAQPAAALLSTQIAAVDFAVFDSFNKCSAPAELKKHAAFFTEDVEFYHDTGGVTWNRKDMIANTEKYACGHYRRELVAGTMKVFPVKEFGAIEQGVHRFCSFETGSCDGLADFVIVWRKQNEQWKATRILSYGHRTAEAKTD
ncbi:nuclear transport factor 2 family protein [Shewanella sp. S-1]|uniref:Nuclear transport factor 2 family protein n=1 Tax=Shewanella oncorhynchi TaxID=2726434 RepID=A0ABX1KSN4_9GAMM|nr:nuclear transport factor 2 family protein [Shewanella oncorhynchi]NLQ25237.1 nuclear transport factor 2 family protein [Shewanella oncorhynchi]